MSISSTVEVNDTATTSHSDGQKSSTINGDAPQVDGIATNQVIDLPVQVESPAAAMHLAIQGDRPKFIPGNSALAISETANIAEVRSIGSSTLQASEIVFMVGKRPIGASHLHVTHTVQMSGLRPIASNDTEDGDSLLGYLD